MWCDGRESARMWCDGLESAHMWCDGRESARMWCDGRESAHMGCEQYAARACGCRPSQPRPRSRPGTPHPPAPPAGHSQRWQAAAGAASIRPPSTHLHAGHVGQLLRGRVVQRGAQLARDAPGRQARIDGDGGHPGRGARKHVGQHAQAVGQAAADARDCRGWEGGGRGGRWWAKSAAPLPTARPQRSLLSAHSPLAAPPLRHGSPWAKPVVRMAMGRHISPGAPVSRAAGLCSR